jgi:hypothetical protein
LVPVQAIYTKKTTAQDELTRERGSQLRLGFRGCGLLCVLGSSTPVTSLDWDGIAITNLGYFVGSLVLEEGKYHGRLPRT